MLVSTGTASNVTAFNQAVCHASCLTQFPLPTDTREVSACVSVRETVAIKRGGGWCMGGMHRVTTLKLVALLLVSCTFIVAKFAKIF